MRMLSRRARLLAAASLAGLYPLSALATIGSGNVAVIEPPVAHPREAACVVPLYKNAQFGASNVNFNYNPPANCPGPYATIVLSVDVSLDAGIQYDRTGTIWVAGVPLWFGTTAEPSPVLAPSWHFERDVTDYTSVLAAPQTGFVIIANYTNSQDTSIITSSAKLLFYPATAKFPAPRVPDMVIPFASPGGGTVGLNDPTQTLTITPTLPANIEAASLDVYLQGQGGDEFWYTCVPNSLSTELESCGGGALREGEITIDNTPAGFAPVSPWIFTGGIDPYLWTPIPGVQTLDFKPFRVELSPFAAQLSTAGQHSIGLSVYGDDNYFSVAGALFLYLDAGSTQVTGGVTQNTLQAAPSVKTTNTISATNTLIHGNVKTTENRSATIAGDAVTSSGQINYTVQQSTNFSNIQHFKISDSVYVQDITQSTATVVQATAAGPNGTTETIVNHTWPLTVDITVKPAAHGNDAQATMIDQQFTDTWINLLNGNTVYQNQIIDQISTMDTLLFNGSGLVGNKGQASTATYFQLETGRPCYEHQLASQNGLLISDTTGCE